MLAGDRGSLVFFVLIVGAIALAAARRFVG